MPLSNLGHYISRYKRVSSEDSFYEANKKTFNIIMTGILDRIHSITSNFEKPFGEKGNLLFIESTNQTNGWGLGDGIFKTSLISDIGSTSGINLDMVTHKSRLSVFENNPHINDLYPVGEINELYPLGKALKEKSYDGVILFYPNWEMLFLKNLVGLRTKTFLERKDYDHFKTVNHIEMYRDAIRKKIPSIVKGDGKTLIVLNDNETIEAKNILDKDPEKIYIGINVGAKCALRHFKNWGEIIDALNTIFPNRISFVLYGRDNSKGADKELEERFDNIINLVGKTGSLRMLYSVMNEMNLNIGADGGNINASIALGKLTLPIYSVVNGKDRLPDGFDENDIIQGTCEKGNCFGTSFGITCEITNQTSEQHDMTPPCLSCNSVVQQIISRSSILISGM